jgi:hypothetical protein
MRASVCPLGLMVTRIDAEFPAGTPHVFNEAAFVFVPPTSQSPARNVGAGLDLDADGRARVRFADVPTQTDRASDLELRVIGRQQGHHRRDWIGAWWSARSSMLFHGNGSDWLEPMFASPLSVHDLRGDAAGHVVWADAPRAQPRSLFAASLEAPPGTVVEPIRLTGASHVDDIDVVEARQRAVFTVETCGESTACGLYQIAASGRPPASPPVRVFAGAVEGVTVEHDLGGNIAVGIPGRGVAMVALDAGGHLEEPIAIVATPHERDARMRPVSLRWYTGLLMLASQVNPPASSRAPPYTQLTACEARLSGSDPTGPESSRVARGACTSIRVPSGLHGAETIGIFGGEGVAALLQRGERGVEAYWLGCRDPAFGRGRY